MSKSKKPRPSSYTPKPGNPDKPDPKLTTTVARSRKPVPAKVRRPRTGETITIKPERKP